LIKQANKKENRPKQTCSECGYFLTRHPNLATTIKVPYPTPGKGDPAKNLATGTLLFFYPPPVNKPDIFCWEFFCNSNKLNLEFTYCNQCNDWNGYFLAISPIEFRKEKNSIFPCDFL